MLNAIWKMHTHIALRSSWAHSHTSLPLAQANCKNCENSCVTRVHTEIARTANIFIYFMTKTIAHRQASINTQFSCYTFVLFRLFFLACTRVQWMWNEMERKRKKENKRELEIITENNLFFSFINQMKPINRKRKRKKWFRPPKRFRIRHSTTKSSTIS